MSNQKNISIETVVIIGGIILMFPLLKGLFSVSTVVSDVLRAPGRLIDKLNQDMDDAINAEVYKLLKKIVERHVYDPNDIDDIGLMRIIKETQHPYNARALINTWKAPKGMMLLMNAIRENLYRKSISDILTWVNF